eukprot:5311450-Pyramimonas_sp.AAC.1
MVLEAAVTAHCGTCSLGFDRRGGVRRRFHLIAGAFRLADGGDLDRSRIGHFHRVWSDGEHVQAG